jgi:CheY-like chemotaxis protein
MISQLPSNPVIGTRLSMARRESDYSAFIYLAIVLSGLAILVADLYTPLGIAVWVIYLVPVVLSFVQLRPALPLLVALIATVMMISTYLTDTRLEGITVQVALVNRIFGVLTLWVMAAFGFFFIRNKLAIRHQQWLQQGQNQLNEVLRGELELRELSQNLLAFLATHLDAHAGALYVDKKGTFQLTGTFGTSTASEVVQSFERGDGLLGQAAASKQTFVVSDVPPGYLQISSALGKGAPRHLVVAPLYVDRVVNGVLELGFMRELGEPTLQFINLVTEAIGTSFRSAHYRSNLHELLEETQRQAEELETQSEELRVSNEELEEQSKALKESQRQLELQQIELEQTNTQLEEQASRLEQQRDELAKASEQLEIRARELQRASQFKSDFLANMSHELRTPLNSSLILAKLLADNPTGNLTEEQVRSAKTIQSSGNDLLTLINDILDLSKIEAGRMDVHPEMMQLSRLAGDLSDTFTPLADAKQLEFSINIDRDVPESIETDPQRLAQVLNNLLSNAIKFTERGKVALVISPLPEGGVALTVSDTGIGIEEELQPVIFEAFRQGDGTTNRKFGGTGLGLSIARQLTGLLGGTIRFESQVGQGTTFTVELPAKVPRQRGARPSVSAFAPEEAQPAMSRSQQTGGMPRSSASPTSPAATPRPIRPLDDRDQLSEGDRRLLVVEDDLTFVSILYDLAHELGFKCLIACSADEALATAAEYRPSAILLDIGLPDQSGLSVLERLKSDPRLRHIPVHVVSASDHTEAALSLGAVGYIVKPVTREVLSEAMRGLEDRLVKKVRRVLLVEDDSVQRESLAQFLRTGDVETVGVASAAECLEQLRDSTFDCMVLDLKLPDTTGLQLLETLSREQAYSFPPVIVYTGRDLSSDEEQQLRRYSSSIIIKGAKSPERLLDEVTLFLHQVVEDLPPAQQQMILNARSRESRIENRRILIVEDDVRNVFALTSVLEPRGALLQIARNGREAVEALEQSLEDDQKRIDLVLMDVMMPEMDGLTATRLIRQRPEFKKLPILVLTAKAMKEDQQNCLAAGANDYMAKPLDVDKLLSLIRVWMPK